MPCRALALALTVLAVLPAAASGAVDRTKPTTPTNVRVTGTTSNSVTLAWGASTDNSGSVSYVVHEAGGLQRAASATTLSFTGLTAGRTYRFNVYAVDPSGNRSADS